MNKRYIDFVPTGKVKTADEVATAKTPRGRTDVGARSGAVAFREMPQRREVQQYREARQYHEVQQRREAPQRREVIQRYEISTERKIGFSGENEPTLGVIEDLNKKFVKKEVEKRPLGASKPVAKRDDAKEAKAKRLVGRKNRAQVVDKPVEKLVDNRVENPANNSAKNTYSVPKTPFINQEKVVKRPLSRNVYQKKVTEPKEEQGPVTIIAKPEKDGFAGRVIAIIIIIILGATAGTVAFLLFSR